MRTRREAYVTSVDANIQILYENVARLDGWFVSDSHNSGRCSKI